jgi:hypothetical protein
MAAAKIHLKETVLRFAYRAPSVKRQRAVTGRQQSRSNQYPTRFRRRVSFRVFDDEQRVRLDEGLSGIDCRQQFAGAVRRIQKNHVEGLGSNGLFSAGKPSADNSIAVGDAAASKVGVDERDGAWIAFDERHVRGPAAQGLNPDRSGARESIQHARALNSSGENVEQGLAEFVGCGTETFPRGSVDTAAFECTGDDSHLGHP